MGGRALAYAARVAETEFGVKYDGPAIVDGRMPVRDLAPALLALGEMFAEASVLLYPDRKPLALDIKATNEGSFLVHLILSTKDHLIDLFGSDGATALLNLKDYIVGGGIGIFWLLKRLRGRRITSHESVPESGQIRLTLDDGTSFEIPVQVFELYRTVEIRKKAREVVEPLAASGIDVMEFRSDNEVTVRVETPDLPAYAVPETVEVPLGEIEVPMVVSIAAVAFVDGNKWRLTDGDSTFYASIEDKGFIERVEHGIEAFRKGDMLRCQMRIVQSQRDGGLHTEHVVREVLEHIPRETQLRLDGDT